MTKQLISAINDLKNEISNFNKNFKNEILNLNNRFNDLNNRFTNLENNFNKNLIKLDTILSDNIDIMQDQNAKLDLVINSDTNKKKIVRKKKIIKDKEVK